jgi:hypothetical protein
MTRRLIGLTAAAALWLGTTADARAQFSMAIGNPYTGASLFAGNAYGLGGYGLGGFGYGYNPMFGAPFGGYNPMFGAPMTRVYSSGFYGVGPGLGVGPFGPAWGYGRLPYRYGFRRGFVRPFGRNRFGPRWW